MPEDDLSKAYQDLMEEIAKTWTFKMKTERPYARWQEAGFKPGSNLKIIEGSIVKIDPEQKALPAPQEGGEQDVNPQ